ncbi:hypothetical protein V1478_013764 [Vespula squamosa]|uniref:Uncharacterized protein n=1 Tax=Vespula squamosa TaxID=30214 RepID=A0ABD2A621_VESSQ
MGNYRWSSNRKKCGFANVKLDLKETCTVEDRDPFYNLIRFTPRNENLSVHSRETRYRVVL